MAFCSVCGTDKGAAAACPRCGTSSALPPPPPPPSSGHSPPPPPPSGPSPAGPSPYPPTSAPFPATYPPPPQNSGKKIAAGLCGIFLGVFGVHKFVLGYTSEGVIMLVIGLFTCGIATSIIGLIEGIIYLTKTDAEFDAVYVHNKRGWF